jgi:hypothetical protein
MVSMIGHCHFRIKPRVQISEAGACGWAINGLCLGRRVRQ